MFRIISCFLISFIGFRFWTLLEGLFIWICFGCCKFCESKFLNFLFISFSIIPLKNSSSILYCSITSFLFFDSSSVSSWSDSNFPELNFDLYFLTLLICAFGIYSSFTGCITKSLFKSSSLYLLLSPIFNDFNSSIWSSNDFIFFS